MLQLLAQRELLSINTVPTQFKPTWHKTVYCHSGCINALAFNRNGNLLVTGGDDLDLGFHTYPWLSFTRKVSGHLSNIFSVAADSNDLIVSCGRDGFLIRNDLNSTARQLYLAHDDACLKVSISPVNNDLVLTAGQDGWVKLWDFRCSRESFKISGRCNFNSVEFNPVHPDLFLTSDDSGGILLFDQRMVASNDHNHLLQFNTKLFRGEARASTPDVISAVWCPDGKLIGSLLQSFKPVVYKFNDPLPVCILDVENDDSNYFQSNVTIKTGAFSTTFGSKHFFCGSENGVAYGWEIPCLDGLYEYRTQNIVNDTGCVV
jgi:WD40 repeat protein